MREEREGGEREEEEEGEGSRNAQCLLLVPRSTDKHLYYIIAYVL